MFLSARPPSNGLENATDPTEALPCWIEVDLDRVAENVRSLRQWVGARTAIAAVVKAQAYGLGAPEVARAALAAGAQALAVARVHEGVELRKAGLRAPILVLSRTDSREARPVVQYDLTVTVDSAHLARALGTEAQRAGREVGVQVKIDTGLHRFGIEPQDALPLARALSETPGLRMEAVWTHFASADEPDLSSVFEQMRLFEQVVRQLEDSGYRFPIRHAANSAATIAVRASHLDMVRVGLSLYGVTPLAHGGSGPELRPAISLKARVGRVMEVKPGEAVGYGQTWRAERRSRAALLTVGYADGVPRSLSNQGVAWLAGREAPILGRVSMDHVVVDVTDIPGVAVGSQALLLGGDEGAGPGLWRVARAAGTIPHELLTGIGGRVPRVYHEDGRIIRVVRSNGSIDLSDEMAADLEAVGP